MSEYSGEQEPEEQPREVLWLLCGKFESKLMAVRRGFEDIPYLILGLVSAFFMLMGVGGVT